jgi:chorismate-pyruvate lyase
MTPLAAKVNSLLYPLETFYATGPRGPRVEALEAGDLPQPYRRLLDHESDMTSTLEGHCGSALRLCVLQMQRRGERLFRHVVLVADADRAPIEYGAICINLPGLPATARRDVLAAERPLGAILRAHAVACACRAAGFFQMECTPIIRDVFGVKGRARLYGRHAEISGGDNGALLAEVVEVLPPMRPRRTG